MFHAPFSTPLAQKNRATSGSVPWCPRQLRIGERGGGSRHKIRTLMRLCIRFKHFLSIVTVIAVIGRCQIVITCCVNVSNRDCCQTSMVGYMGLRKFCKMLSTLICILAINVLFFVNALVVCKIVISLSLNVFVCMSSTELKLFLFQFLISVSLIRNLCIRSLKNSKTNRAC